MIVIIDGYNLLFHADWPAQGQNLAEQRSHLVREMAEYRQRRQIRRMIVVFDGQIGVGPYDRHQFSKGLEIVYAVCSGKADEKIIELTRQLYGVCVVTADRILIDKVKNCHANVTTTEEFISNWRHSRSHLERQQNLAPPQSPGEVEYWLQLFALDAEIDIDKFGE